MKKGFTLIELLVVVLIVGILASIALPQYFKAVEKSHAAGVLSIMGTLTSAMERHRLVHGSYPLGIEALDIAMIDFATGQAATGNTFETKSFTVQLVDSHSQVWAARKIIENADGLALYQIRKHYGTGKLICLGDGERGDTICQSLGLPQE